MSNRTLQHVEPECRQESFKRSYGLDAWLRQALAAEFGTVSRDPLPEMLRSLLPAE